MKNGSILKSYMTNSFYLVLLGQIKSKYCDHHSIQIVNLGASNEVVKVYIQKQMRVMASAIVAAVLCRFLEKM